VFIGIFRFTHWFKQIPDFAVKTTENKMRKNRLQVASGCKQQREKHLPFPLCDTDRTQTCNLLIRRHNSAVFADFRRFLFCFINVCISGANIAILFHCIFVKLDLIHMFVYKLCTENQNLYTK
jgi:hypothetical protein